MVNLCDNKITLIGEPSQLKSFTEKLTQPTTIYTYEGVKSDFRCIPADHFLLKCANGSEEVIQALPSQDNQPCFENLIQFPIETLGDGLPYWNKIHLGCYFYTDLTLQSDNLEQGEVVLWFSSAWEPPEQLTCTLSQTYKDLNFHHVFYEPSSESYGAFDYANGQCTKNVSSDNVTELEMRKLLENEGIVEYAGECPRCNIPLYSWDIDALESAESFCECPNKSCNASLSIKDDQISGEYIIYTIN